MTKRRDDPPGDLDVTGEPEPEWADAIRRARRERGERLKRMLGDDPAPAPTITPPPVREDTPQLGPPPRPRRPALRVIRSEGSDEDQA